MMTLKDYAEDVGKSIDEIKALCDKIGIDYQDENSNIDETSIILLDNEIQDQEVYIEGDIENLEERILEEEVEEVPRKKDKKKKRA